MKKVILATDFSENANNAVDYAIQLFGLKNVEYTLLNTYVEPKAATNVVVSMNDLMRKESLEGLEKNEAKLKEKYAGISLETKSYYGIVSSIINQLAEKIDYNFLVVGTKGISALENLVMGSNALSVVKNVTLPTLFIPKEYPFTSVKTIAFAADYEHLDSIHMLDPMVALTKENKATLKIVNVQKGEDEPNYEQALEGLELHNLLEGVDHEFCTERNPNVVTGIYDFANKNNVQILAMVARKHSLFDRLFHKSVTQEITKLSHMPYLVLHE